jgi:hypothetical protein
MKAAAALVVAVLVAVPVQLALTGPAGPSGHAEERTPVSVTQSADWESFRPRGF